MSVLRVIWGILAVIGGVYVALGIWLPSLRGQWGGVFTGKPKGDRDRVRGGAVSSAGFGLLFISLGLISLSGDVMPKPLGAGLVACVFAAFFLIIGGWLLDSHVHDSERRAYGLPGESRMTPEARQRWILASCGALILVMMILALIFHG